MDCLVMLSQSKDDRNTRGKFTRSTNKRQDLWEQVAYEGVPKSNDTKIDALRILHQSPMAGILSFYSDHMVFMRTT
jgi:hypothetical protein